LGKVHEDSGGKVDTMRGNISVVNLRTQPASPRGRPRVGLNYRSFWDQG